MRRAARFPPIVVAALSIGSGATAAITTGAAIEGCGGDSLAGDGDGAPTGVFTAAPMADANGPMSDAMAVPDPNADGGDAGDPGDAAPPGPDGGDAGDAAPDPCKKHLTVLLSVGVPGESKWHGNGCWTVRNADGGGNPNWRKCSTSQMVVKNASAPNYAYDDTNPSRAYSIDQNFLDQCSKGATGDGFEYMAYRGGWRLIGGAPNLRAFFAELYGNATDDIDSLWFVSGVYKNNPTLKPHTVYPMINYGPPQGSGLEKKIENDSVVICDTIKDGGYFGTYNASWRETWNANDSRLQALERALDKCTGL